MEKYCLTGQSSQWALVPMKEEEEEERKKNRLGSKIQSG